MKVVSLNHLPKLSSSVVTLGVFDGVHLAHKKIIYKTVAESRRLSAASRGTNRIIAKSVVLTFEKHPKKTTHKNAPLILTTVTKKIELIKALGVDVLVLIDFNKSFAKITAKSFIENILIGKFKAKEVVIGHDYGFGKDKEGNAALLKKEGKLLGFKTTVVEQVLKNGRRISSTLIREAVQKGNIEKAASYLGRNYSVIGKVEAGKKLGRTFGFPTANLNCLNEAIPKEGVYAVKILFDNKWYKGACSITSPTFDKPGKTTQNPEIFIFDFKKSIYNKILEVFFVKKIRGSKNFAGVPALVNQIKKDVRAIKSILR